MEGFTRKLEQKMNRTPSAAPEPERAEYLSPRLTLDEIKTTKDKEFGAFIASAGKPKTMEHVWERYVLNESTAADVDQLATLVEEFNARTENAERLVHTFGDYFSEISQGSSELTRLSKNFGTEKLKTVTQKGLIEFAYKEPKTFAKIESHFKQLEQTDEKEHALNATIQAFCDKHNLLEDELVEAMQHTDPEHRQKAVQLLMRHKMGFWDRIKDDFRNHVTQGGTLSQARGMSTRQREFVDIVTLKKTFLADAGSSLAALLSKNEDLRKALIHTAEEEVEIDEGIQSHMSYDEARGDQFDVEKFEAHAARFKDRIPNWDTLPSAAQDRAFETAWNGFERDEFKEKAGGFWAAIARFLFGKKKNEAKEIFKRVMESKKAHA